MHQLKVQLALLSFLLISTEAFIAVAFHEYILLIALGCIVLTVVYSLVASRIIFQPLRRINGILKSIEDDKNPQTVDIRSTNEVGELAVSLNSLLEKLHSDIIRMKKLEKVRTEFLANVSHELRTPIFSIQSMIETLLQGAVDDPSVNRNFLEKTLKNIERLNALLTDLIDLTRLEYGEIKLSFRYFDVHQLLRSVVTDMQPHAQRRKVSLSLEPPDGKPVQIYGDKDRLQLVMTNLIDNGLKYTDAGGLVVLRCTETAEKAEISVEDTGIGIASSHLQRIFERFYRVDKDRSREAGGTGLGLAIVKHILEAHHSSIHVESEVSKGTKFSFELSKTTF